MQPVRPLFYVRGGPGDQDPMGYGTAVYCRVWIAEYDFRDFWWDKEREMWVKSDYLGRLLSRGEPDLDEIEHSDLPEGFPWPDF